MTSSVEKPGHRGSALAIHGGTPVRTAPFPQTITTGEEEVQAAIEVIRSGALSGFVGSPSPEFRGGTMVRRLEEAWRKRFEIAHAVSCNSATSALIMAIGAAGIGPGDEVIVSPYTMSATAMAVLLYGGIPVFADIESDCFCLDPASVRRRITQRTKAILTTDIHGQSSAMDELSAIAREHRLLVIADCAQSAGALYNNKHAGTLCDIGVFSLNRHKNMQCGEGGVAVTPDAELALRMQLIRNHGENLVETAEFRPQSLANMIGFNLRMTEVEAAIAIEQLKKMDALNQIRIDHAAYLNGRLADYPALTLPAVRKGCTHIFYMHAMKFEASKADFSRDVFTRALNAEGIPIRGGYVRPLYLEPVFQKKIAIGDKGFPFVGPHYDGDVSYAKGICPVAEDLFENRTLINAFVYPPLSRADMADIVAGIDKVFDNAARLRE
jgi:dTDP-4-amino-4,6-dideoxygalactose transaminase